MLMKGASPVPEATNSDCRPSSWSRNLPFAPLMSIGSPTLRSHRSGVKPPESTSRMKNSYSERSSADEEMLIGRRTSLPSGPMSPSVAYCPGSNGNDSSSDCTPTMASPGDTSSQRLSRPL